MTESPVDSSTECGTIEEKPGQYVLKQVQPASENKRYKKGILYLSKIPPHMNVTQLTEFMSRFGEVGRVYLVPKKSKYLLIIDYWNINSWGCGQRLH